MSPNFTDEEKSLMIEKIPTLNEHEVNDALKVFEKEQAELKEIMKRMKNDENLMKMFVTKSTTEFDKLSKRIVKKIELDEQVSTDKKAEDLLNSL